MTPPPTMITEPPTLATEPPTAATAPPTAPPTVVTEPPTTAESQNLGFIILAEGSTGFLPAPDRIPDMLGGLRSNAGDIGDILPVLASASSLTFDPNDPFAVLGQGFSIPLPPGTYLLSISDVTGDRTSYTFELGITLLPPP